MKYKLLKSNPYNDTLKDFENQVNEYMAKGWQPQGGVVILPVNVEDKNSLGAQFIQAMIEK